MFWYFGADGDSRSLRGARYYSISFYLSLVLINVPTLDFFGFFFCFLRSVRLAFLSDVTLTLELQPMRVNTRSTALTRYFPERLSIDLSSPNRSVRLSLKPNV
jgi:hypothetical protein